ncbi:hypothetical protein D3C79_1029460 [compost metagenome]
MRLAGLEALQITLVHHLATVQHDKPVGAGLLQVARQRQGLLAGIERHLVQWQLSACWQG